MTMAAEMWELIPAVYRRRDAESGDVLRAIVEVLGEQADIIRDDIARLYDDWFIETCDDWVVPYIGELIGAHPTAPGGQAAGVRDLARLGHVAPGRMMVANTIRWRRRKGAFALLGQIVWDVSRWPAQVVEFGAKLAVNQDMRFPSGSAGVAALRDPGPLALIGGPSDVLPRAVDVRLADAERSPGRFGAMNLGLFVFRHTIVQIASADALSIDDEISGRFTFDPLGREVQLYYPSSVSGAGDAETLPGLISRDRLGVRRATDAGGSGWRIDPRFYGEAGCTRLWEQRAEGEPFHPVEPDRIVPANLARWRERPTGNLVAVDPELGRIAFSEKRAPHRGRVSYAYATTGAIGAPSGIGHAGEAPFDKVYVVSADHEQGHRHLKTALEQWRKDAAGYALIEIRDDATYEEDRVLIDLSGEARRLVIRAAPGRRPVIRLRGRDAGAVDGWRVRGAHEGVAGPPASRLTLEGLTIAESGLLIEAFAGDLSVRNCTLVPGGAVEADGSRGRPDAASLAFENCSGSVRIVRSITGPLFVRADELIEAPLSIEILDSIVDAGEGRATLLAPDTIPYVELRLRRCTIIGSMAAHSVDLAENTIFTGRLEVARRQKGCIRYCFVPPGSRTPRRFSCLPRQNDAPSAPVFVSRIAGAPGYGQLAPDPEGTFQTAADDHGELGAYHALFWTIKDANLRAALAEYTPAGVSAGIIYLA
jgi:hypothetical protein